MRKLFIALLVVVVCVACETKITDSKAYSVTTRLIEDQLGSTCLEIDFPTFDYQYDDIKNDTYIIVSYFTFENEYGAKQKYKYKAKVQYNGSGDWVDTDNWTLHYVEPYNQ